MSGCGVEETRQFFDRIAVRFDRINRKLRWIGPEWVSKHAQELAHLYRVRALDVACGTGLHIKILRARITRLDAVGIDLSSEMIEVARRTECYEQLHVHDMHYPMPFLNPGEFDLVCALGFMEFLTDAAVCLSEIHRVMKPGGRLWISFLQEGPAFAVSKRHSYSASEVLDMMAKHDMKVGELEVSKAYFVEELPVSYFMVRAQKQ